MGGKDVGAVKVYRDVIRSLLEKAAAIKNAPTIEPPVTEANLGDIIERVLAGDYGISVGANQQTQYAAVETAFREIFYDLLVRPLPPVPLGKPLLTHPLVGYYLYRRALIYANMESFRYCFHLFGQRYVFQWTVRGATPGELILTAFSRKMRTGPHLLAYRRTPG